MFIDSGTSMQSYSAAVISMIFLVIHVREWSYPFLGSNVLKMFSEVQILLVMITSQILRSDPETLKNEGYSLEFYQNLLDPFSPFDCPFFSDGLLNLLANCNSSVGLVRFAASAFDDEFSKSFVEGSRS